jgi:hypothetical protein
MANEYVILLGCLFAISAVSPIAADGLLKEVKPTVSMLAGQVEFLQSSIRDELRKACGVTPETFPTTKEIMLVIEELLEALRTQVNATRVATWTFAEYSNLYNRVCAANGAHADKVLAIQTAARTFTKSASWTCSSVLSRVGVSFSGLTAEAREIASHSESFRQVMRQELGSSSVREDSDEFYHVERWLVLIRTKIIRKGSQAWSLRLMIKNAEDAYNENSELQRSLISSKKANFEISKSLSDYEDAIEEYEERAFGRPRRSRPATVRATTKAAKKDLGFTRVRRVYTAVVEFFFSSSRDELRAACGITDENFSSFEELVESIEDILDDVRSQISSTQETTLSEYSATFTRVISKVFIQLE